MPSSNSFWDDSNFQNLLVHLLCRDITSLRSVAHLLNPDDFKPLRPQMHGRARWIIAERALSYYQKYHEPIGKLLRADVMDYAEQISLGDRGAQELTDYIKLLRELKPTSPNAITDKVTRYKRQQLKARAVQELSDLQSSGQLTDEKWQEIHQKLFSPNGDVHVVDYFTGLETRLARRQLQKSAHERNPLLLIEPFDVLLPRLPGPEHLAVVIGPMKRGKSLFLLHVACAYALQGINVLFVTLEDPLSEVEDRLDAAITKIPMQQLSELPKLTVKRFQQFRRLIRSRLKIVDGTEGGMTVAKIEAIMLRERDHGFLAGASIIDYDDEIVPPRKQKERRFEFADIYRELRQYASRHHQIVWTGAQTQRDTENLKILTPGKVAEDISKLRKATWAVGLGQGDWGPDSIYLHVIVSKIGPPRLGVNIMPDTKRMVFYDADKTKLKMLAAKQEETEE